MEDGSVVEVATVGREGLVGVSAVFGAPVATGEAFVQIPGEPAAVMGIESFRREMDRRGAFYDRVTKYSQAFVNMLMQSVACNGLHSAEQRCCRWLLTTHDRIGQDEFPLTHEFLAIMLGVRRPTVTLVMAELTRDGRPFSRPGARAHHRSARASRKRRVNAIGMCGRRSTVAGSRRSATMSQSDNKLLASLPRERISAFAAVVAYAASPCGDGAAALRAHPCLFPRNRSLLDHQQDGRWQRDRGRLHRQRGCRRHSWTLG